MRVYAQLRKLNCQSAHNRSTCSLKSLIQQIVGRRCSMAIGTWRLLRSKEAIIIIVWYAVISLWMQGSGLAPVYLFDQSNPQYGQWTYTICIALSYPIIGLLADMWVGRHKIITFSLWLKWTTVIAVTLVSSLVVTISNTSITPNVSETNADVLITVLTAFEQIGLTSFQVTAIQFGTDQLQGAPKDHISSFIFWYIFVEQIATPTIEWVNYSLYFTKTLNTYKWVVFGWPLLVASLLTAILSIKTCFMSNWFVREPGTPNPYRLVYHVIRFALKHKQPLQHNAQWENKQPSRLDYGMYKYGGPFTAEEVENVKKLLKLGAVLVSLFGIFITAYTLQGDWQSLVLVHIGGRTPTPKNSLPLLLEASCDTVILVLLIPLHELVIYPVFQKYIPSMLKRIWMGAVLIIACAMSVLVIDAIGHSVNTDIIECYRIKLLFNVTEPYVLSYYSTLGINSAFILIPNFLYGLAVLTFHIPLIEFIVIRSPHSMKGMLLGLYYTFRYGISECFPLSLQYVFDYHSNGHHLSCASSFYLMLSIIALLSLIGYTVVAYKIRNWDEHEEIDVHSFVEEQEEVVMYQEN